MRHFASLLVVAVSTALAACSSSSQTGGGSTPPAKGADLTQVCPSTVVIQTDWEPEAEHGAIYELLGPGYTIDANKKRVTGPLVIDGKNTGIKIEIRAGGSAIGFQAIPAQMYVDKTITLGFVNTEDALSAAASQPVTAVIAPLTKSPGILLWDPASHPTWTKIADIGHSNAKVVVSKAQVFSALLVNEGLVRADQLDTSYDGSPARFVADPTIAQQGFATEEPYIYQHELPAWGKPVKYQLLTDVGYNSYPQALSVRSGDLAALSPCLTKLVPIIQKAAVNYITNPASANETIVSTVKKYNDGWTYSAGVAAYAASTMRDLHIVANDASGPLGGMDMTRVQKAINTFTPIIESSGATVKAGLVATDIATDKFIDKTIRIK